MKIGDIFPVKELSPAAPKAAAGKAPAAGAAALDLAAGQLVKARVAGHLPGGKLLLDIAGQTIVARSGIALPVGRELWLEVRQTGATLWFSMADSKGAVHELLRQIVSDAPQLGRAMEAFIALAADPEARLPAGLAAVFGDLPHRFAAAAFDGEPDPAKLLSLLSWLNAGARGGNALPREGLGEQLAALWATLKQSGAFGETRAMLPGLEKLVKLAAAFQQVNSGTTEAGQTGFLLYPCFFAGEAGWGQWMFSLDREAEAGSDAESAAYSLTFFLTMSRLGDVHLAMSAREGAITGVLAAEHEAAQAHIENHLPELGELLKGLGYGPVTLRCKLADHSLMQELKTALGTKAGLKPAGILDITA